MESSTLVKSGLAEVGYFIAQNPQTDIVQLFAGDKNGGQSCYCPFVSPIPVQNGGLLRMSCDTNCPHATAKQLDGGKYEYRITCGGLERVYECEMKADPHAANEKMPSILRAR